MLIVGDDNLVKTILTMKNIKTMTNIISNIGYTFFIQIIFSKVL